ncbi:MAG TPA: M13 family metallopeptidase [Anaeromyxobacteraceae bacterium]|nr:M13 family metallopeptidase [Anaeromyxobacteraceae bacterium]
MTRILAAALGLAASAPLPEPRPLPQIPYTPGLDPAAMDRRADPCASLYAFSCGGWQQRNPIPPDQASWSVYAKLADENEQFLWGLLDEAARPGPARSPEERQMGDYFAACMDERAVEEAGARPLRADLAAISGMKGKGDVARVLGRLQAVSGALLGLGSQQSFEDADQVVAAAQPAGLGLPDRDLYLAGDARSRETRRAYRAHLERMFGLLGEARATAAASARTVMRIETALARGSLTRVERRDPRRIWHRTLRAELAGLTPSFRWDEYLAASGAPPFDWLNVEEPDFLRAVEGLLEREPIAAWKAYLRWHLVRARAPYLSRPFQRESFAFYGAFLHGMKQERPRWKRCVSWTDRDLGEALGRVFVARAFPEPVKRDVEALVRRIEDAMRERILGLDWMGQGTRRAALEKLETMRNKIGYPGRWRDYSALAIDRRDFAGNVERAARFEAGRQLRKIGRPVDRGEWQMTPPTVNAYYDPSLNEMNFPAGVLLPPLWDPGMDLAPGYGNTGGTVGHELVHGFDDEGRRFDARGNLKDWWTPADAAEFEKRAACIADQYAQYPVVDGIRINSRLTLGEDIADLGGAIVAWHAWKAATRGQALEPRDGLAPEQRFFVGLAQWACASERPEALRLRALTDPHSPPRWRIDGVVANMPEFARAFDCRPGQPLVRERPCRIW